MLYKLIDLLTEFDKMGYIPTTFTENPEQAAIDWKNRLVAAIEADNAALSERLDKAVILPCKLGDKLFYVNEYFKIPKIEEHTVTAFTILSEYLQIHVQIGGYFFCRQ